MGRQIITRVIYGAPCSGKSTYVKDNSEAGDIIFDFDKINQVMTKDGSNHSHDGELINSILKLRSQLITDIKTGKIKSNVWLIATFLTKELEQELTGTDAIIVKLNTPIEECIRRLEEEPDGRDKKRTLEIINKWYTKTEDASEFYNSKAWKDMRESILKRDLYLCRECKAFGKRTEATEVHHVFTLATRPDLKLNPNNLISLCRDCHLSHHNHLNSDLSALGKKTQRRIGLKYNLFKSDSDSL